MTRLFNQGNGMEDKFNTPNALLDDGTYDIGAPNVTTLVMVCSVVALLEQRGVDELSFALESTDWRSRKRLEKTRSSTLTQAQE